ncbi:hypothetical protein KW791_00490 [Candidatus Parcubacteria bacterium]|nr:hypothetical protein [Candidatus Parcubacteria bacterium]
MIVRVDDVSPNTNMADLNKSAEFMHEVLGAEIWYCVNLFSKLSIYGSVYPDLPMRNRDLKYFMDVDRIMRDFAFPEYVKKVSHGLIHSDHGKMSDGAQELSIVTSCRFLGADTFVTPFTSWNEATERICEKNRITLINGQGWKSLESEPFSIDHDKWFFHPWRMNSSQIRVAINACKINA